MGSVHARNVAEHSDADLAGIADVDDGAAMRLAQSFATRTGSVEEFLQDSRVDAVVISTPSGTHAELIEQCAGAGKQIFCEKPISLDVATTIRATDASKRAGVLLQIGFQRRFDRDFVQAREAIAAGEVGEMRFLRLVSRDRTLPPIAYIPTSGGQFRDQMVHDFDAARWLLAPAQVEDVTATGVAANGEIAQAGDVDTSVALLRFSNGAMAVLDVSREAAYGYDVRIEALGSRGMLLRGADGMPQGRVLDASFAAPLTDSFITRFADAYREEIHDFIGVLANGGEVRAGGEDALEALRLAIAADRSRERGCVVRFSDVEGG